MPVENVERILLLQNEELAVPIHIPEDPNSDSSGTDSDGGTVVRWYGGLRHLYGSNDSIWDALDNELDNGDSESRDSESEDSESRDSESEDSESGLLNRNGGILNLNPILISESGDSESGLLNIELDSTPPYPPTPTPLPTPVSTCYQHQLYQHFPRILLSNWLEATLDTPPNFERLCFLLPHIIREIHPDEKNDGCDYLDDLSFPRHLHPPIHMNVEEIRYQDNILKNFLTTTLKTLPLPTPIPRQLILQYFGRIVKHNEDCSNCCFHCSLLKTEFDETTLFMSYMKITLEEMNTFQQHQRHTHRELWRERMRTQQLSRLNGGAEEKDAKGRGEEGYLDGREDGEGEGEGEGEEEEEEGGEEEEREEGEEEGEEEEEREEGEEEREEEEEGEEEEEEEREGDLGGRGEGEGEEERYEGGRGEGEEEKEGNWKRFLKTYGPKILLQDLWYCELRRRELRRNNMEFMESMEVFYRLICMDSNSESIRNPYGIFESTTKSTPPEHILNNGICRLCFVEFLNMSDRRSTRQRNQSNWISNIIPIPIYQYSIVVYVKIGSL